MKPYDQLTYLGRMRRMRQLASAALDAYGLAGARFKLLWQAGNTLFRVYAAHPTLPPDDLYLADQYLLRVHEPGYQTASGIELELAWLAAMCRDAHLPVPEPVPALDGTLLVRVAVPGIPGERDCSLLRWLKGRSLGQRIRPHHYRAQGRLMARMHDHAAQWPSPPGLTKRRWDADALFRDVEGVDLTAADVWPLLPPQVRESFEVVISQAGRVMEEWGTGPDVYGLIHADLGVDANLLFWRGEARAIDFDDSGFGYWIYDLAISLEHCRDSPDYAQQRDALLAGYAEIRSLPQDQLARLDLFMASWYVYVSLWCVAIAHLYPRHWEALYSRMERAAGLAARYVAGADRQRHLPRPGTAGPLAGAMSPRTSETVHDP